MSKLLLIGLLVLVAYLALRGAGRRRRPPGPAAPPVQQMVACAQCGVNLPEVESLKAAGLHYCCERHRELGPIER